MNEIADIRRMVQEAKEIASDARIMAEDAHSGYRSVYEGLGQLRQAMTALEARMTEGFATLSNELQARPSSKMRVSEPPMRRKLPSLQELAGEVGGGPTTQWTTDHPLQAWAERGIGKAIVAVARIALTLSIGAGLGELWRLLVR